MMNLAKGAQPEIRFKTDRTKSKYVWGVSYAVVDVSKNTIAKGELPPGEETVVRFNAANAGLYTVVVTAGYYGRCTVLSTTVPYALWTGGKFEISRPGGTVYFYVPEGVKEFDIAAQCHWATNGASLTVSDPDGSVIREQETDPFIRNLKMSVPTDGKWGRLWSLKVEKAPGKSYRSVFIKFDRKLPQAVSLTPGFAKEKRCCACYRLARAPVIDGALQDDPGWARIPEQTGFVRLGTRTLAPKQTTFKMGYTTDALFLGVKCNEPEGAKIRARFKDGDARLWQEDSVELFLFPKGAKTYCHFIVNAIGSRRSKMELRGREIPIKWQACTRRGKDYYSVELKIPLGLIAAAPKGGDEWTANLCRNSLTAKDGRAVRTSWAPLAGGFHEPESFGRMLFVGRYSPQEAERAAKMARGPTRQDNLLKETYVARTRALLASFSAK